MTAAPHDDLPAAVGRALTQLWAQPVKVSSVEPFGSGHSGYTYLVDVLSPVRTGTFVLRLSPPRARAVGPADVGRQGRIMGALHALGLPAPAVHAADSSGLVDGRALALMDRVEGIEWLPAVNRSGADAVVGWALEFLHAVGRYDAAATGLADEPVTSVSDDLHRWRALADRGPEDLLEPIDRLFVRLLARAPADGPPRLVHGDFHYGNLIFAESGLAAVLDWEIAIVGDQRLDLGALAVASLRARYADPNPTGGPQVTIEELAAGYGTSTADASWFTAAACLKYAAILGHNLTLHRRGRRVDPIYEQLIDTMNGLPLDGLALLD